MEDAAKTMAGAVAQTLEELDLPPADAAVSRLMLAYAHQIDQARWVSAAADRVLEAAVEQEPDNVDLHDAVRALRSKLSERTATSDLGAKLLTALESVGATAKARAAIDKGKGGGGGEGIHRGGRLAAIRAARS